MSKEKKIEENRRQMCRQQVHQTNNDCQPLIDNGAM